MPTDPWHSAALAVGEALASVGPPSYDAFSPLEWRAWALARIHTLKYWQDYPHPGPLQGIAQNLQKQAEKCPPPTAQPSLFPIDEL